MSKQYYAIQIKRQMEVCVLAETEEEAEEIARNAEFEWTMADTEIESVDAEYNESGDAHLITEFKEEGRYAESE